MDGQYDPGLDRRKDASCRLWARRVEFGFSGGFIIHEQRSCDSLRVLLVEDDPVSQRIMAKMLNKIGFQADVVGNGLEAISVLQSQFYDVIFMDVQMPQMDGLQATKAIRDRWPCRSLRIIAVTSCSQKGDREKCLRAGMDDYIAKPATEGDILAFLSGNY